MSRGAAERGHICHECPVRWQREQTAELAGEAEVEAIGAAAGTGSGACAEAVPVDAIDDGSEHGVM